MGALGFSLTRRAERAVAVSPAEQTKPLKVINLCSTRTISCSLNCSVPGPSSTPGQDAAGEITRGQDVGLMRFGRSQEEGCLWKGKACQPPRNEEVGGGAPHSPKKEPPPCSPSLSIYPSAPPPGSFLSHSLPSLALTMDKTQAFRLTLLRPLAATLLLCFLAQTRGSSTCPPCPHF